MSLFLLLLSQAFAAELVVDVKIPARVAVDGEVVAEVYREGILRVPWNEGAHRLVITTQGEPRSYEVVAGAEPTLVLVGRTGVTVAKGAPPSAADAPQVAGGVPEVMFRTAAGEQLLVQVGKQRIVVPPGRGVALPLSVGDHPMTVRSADGSSIFARGTLAVTGGTELLVRISEGRLPETAGDGVTFHAVGP